jgi:ABC-type uncharacterized transport system involved in gliding motility auxiliary subunit
MPDEHETTRQPPAGRRPPAVLAVLMGRGARHGSNTAVLIVLALAIAVLANYVAARHHARFDLTRAQANTLSPQTTKILRHLRRPVVITAFYSPAAGDYQQMQDLLREYQYASPRVKAKMIDPELRPGLARQYGVASYPATIVEAGGQREQLSFGGEQEITRAILKLTRTNKKKIYFVQGHGEHDPDSTDPDGYSSAREALVGLTYEVDKLVLLGQAPAPKDCDVLIIAGPRAPFDPREVAAVQRYLERGGKALIMVDPDGQGVPLAEVLEPWGVKPLPDIVVEPNLNFFGDARAVTVVDFAYHDITRPFIHGRALIAVFVLVRAFDLEHKPGLNVQDLIRTSGDSWLESNFKGTIRRNDRERRGPVTIAATVSGAMGDAAADAARRGAGLVIYGDSDFATNAVISNGINRDLLVNSVSWLAEAGELISIQPKQSEAAPVVLTELQRRTVLILVLIVMPLAPLVVGAVVWWRRR